MSKLKFFDETHKYEYDGVELPSVSEVSRFASREVYGNDINKYTLDKAKERGTEVHKATEELDKTGKCNINSQYIEYLNAYIKFREDFNIKNYEFIEKPLASLNMGYAGTLDRVYKIDDDFIKATKKHCKIDLNKYLGYYAIIDLKTSYAVQKTLAKIQLPAYANLVLENFENFKIGGLFILHLNKNGKYKLIPFENDSTLFYSCLNLHKAFIKKKRGNKNGK